jgi:hypothetical protein
MQPSVAEALILSGETGSKMMGADIWIWRFGSPNPTGDPLIFFLCFGPYEKHPGAFGFHPIRKRIGWTGDGGEWQIPAAEPDFSSWPERDIRILPELARLNT